MSHANFILSTCGTALLTNRTNEEDRRRINRLSNTKQIDQIPEADRQWLFSLVEQRREQLQQASQTTVASMSAELNGLIKFYDGVMKRNHDHHLLLCTDTWLGEQVAEIEADWLRGFGATVAVQRQKDLQTAELASFQYALSDLVKWCAEQLPDYQRRGYRVIFNLTGGFKSVQGFLQTLAMFYADEVVYVFQEADALMRIPRLPIKLTPEDTVQEHLNVFRRLGASLKVTTVEGVEETLLFRLGDQVDLSPWGTLAWEQTKKQIYIQRLWPSPSQKICYGENFEDSLKALPPDRLCMVNEKIDDLACYLETGQNPRSLRFHRLVGNPVPPSTHEFYVWSDQDAKRIYGHYEAEKFILDRLGNHL